MFFFHRPPLLLLSKLWTSQLFKHNEAAIELQIGPSSTNKQIWDTMVTTMFYYFLVPEGGHPTWEEIFIEKKYQNARSFFLSHTSKLNHQKQWDVVSKSTPKIYPSKKYNIFPSFIIDQSWNTLQLKNIVLSFHPPFEPISALFYNYRSVA